MFSTGSYLLHQIYINDYKAQQRNYILKHKPGCPVYTITIYPSEVYTNSSNIVWANDGQEVIYEGILYDVVALSNRGLTVDLMLIPDQWETELHKRFLALYANESNQDTDDPFDLLKDFFELETIINKINLEFRELNNEINSLYLSQLFRLTTLVISIETPPPDFFG